MAFFAASQSADKNANKGFNVTIQTVVVPDLGGAETVEVIELGLAPGDSVEVEDSLLVLESDKATMDIPSPATGVFTKYLVEEGATVSVGDPIAEIEVADEAAEEIKEESPQPASWLKKRLQLNLQLKKLLLLFAASCTSRCFRADDSGAGYWQ